ncbi:hypothetical protein [Mycobacterium shinjukuense]|uniref:Uncharacterized protein n=1 Tax=Mycobacterium shinjukuense TaxID=398694 RepID=A0A7I7MTU8_9MYCO|nr:hypothetical protein [Mycobacterium shinjukuense]BBX75360.1 hypothetical protein MSHI_32660 [Mycobacterium shinjukuense]
MIGADRDDPAARVDALVAAVGPRLGVPAINRREVVLVTGPWLAGVSGVHAALRERLPQVTVVEAQDLAPGDAPVAVVFVVSAAAHLTESDCALLDVAAEHTDAVVGVVSKIDVHRGWRDVLAANRDRLTAHAPRYGRVPWVAAAAAPDLGQPRVDELVATVRERLADSDIARRNRLRAWESRLHAAAQRLERDARGAGRRARVDALREQRSTVLRQRRRSRSGRAIALRGQIRAARIQLSYFARDRCGSVREELQHNLAGLSRKAVAGFEAYARDRLDDVVAEVAEGVAARLADVAGAMGVPAELPPPGTLPTVAVFAPPLQSRRLETRLMVLLGAGFGLGVAMSLSRLVAGAAPRLAPGLAPALVAAGIVACVVIGVVVTAVLVRIRGLLHDRAALDRWVGEMTAALRSVTEQLVASRVLVAESVLSTALSARDEAEHARVAEQVSAIDGELRAHAVAAARAAALRDREMPTVQAALDAVRAELAETGTPKRGVATRANPAPTGQPGIGRIGQSGPQGRPL